VGLGNLAQANAGALQGSHAADKSRNPRYDRRGRSVAVRWQLTATYDSGPFEQSIMAIYRFEKGRIAADWGIQMRTLWP
jgi:hypothetical protein